MIARFKDLLESDTYHNKYGFYKNKIGYIQLWAWSNCYLFLNVETGKVQKISLDKISSFKEISSEEFQSIYKSKNTPTDLFSPDRMFIGDKTLYTERQIQYGILHDTYLKHSFENGTNRVWSDNFCRAAANAIASYHFYIEVLEKYGTHEKAKEDQPGLTLLFKKYFMSANLTDVYSTKLETLFGFGKDNPTVSELTLGKTLRKIKTLPDKYSKEILSSGMIKTAKKEFDYYMLYNIPED